MFLQNMLNVIFWLFPWSLLYNPTVAESGTVVTVSAMFRAEILNFLAKQNLQKGMSSSSPKTLSAFLGPEIILSMLSLQIISLRSVAHIIGTLNMAVLNNENSSFWGIYQNLIILRAIKMINTQQSLAHGSMSFIFHLHKL